jgi:glycosyltransferase involved in cell wall biosynthesis
MRPNLLSVKILLWHGYPLGGSGSNVYTRSIARAWSRRGHEVVLFCQESHPDEFDLGGTEVVRPGLPYKLLPVFVLDEYEGLDARLLTDFTPRQRDAYVGANAASLRKHLPADLVFANHVVMGGPVAAATGAPFAVKAHGSELEYALRQSPELADWAAAGLRDARAVFVGSGHIRSVLEEVVGVTEPVYEVPPGVDTDQFRPRGRAEALLALREAGVDLDEFFAPDDPVVLYVGKLLYNKGVHVLLEAMHGVEARVLVVGFGDYREELERLAPPGTVFTGRLEHEQLAPLLPLVDVQVVPSIFPEAFGMVAAEAAAAGVPPLVARHSGLAEVAEGLEAEYPEELRHLTSFSNGDVVELTHRLRELLSLPPDARAELGAAARRAAVEHWSWANVSERLLEPFH